MLRLLSCILCLVLIREGVALRYCKATSYDHDDYHTTTYYSCSGNQYCCNHGCCTSMTRLWYFWTMMVLGIIFLFTCWWYYRFRYRPRQMVVQTVQYTTESGQPMVVIRPIPGRYPHPCSVQAVPLSGDPGNMPQMVAPHYYAPPYDTQAAPPAYFDVVKPQNTDNKSAAPS